MLGDVGSEKGYSLSTVKRLSVAGMTNLLEKMRQADKLQHFCGSFILLLLAQMFLAPLVAALFTFAVGYVKELWDDRYGSGFCWYDMLANLLGIVTALLVLFLISMIHTMA